MKKIMNILLVIMLILIFASMSISYALTDATEEEEETFFKVSSEELEAGDTLEMTIDFTQIEWTQVKFVLTSSQDISSIYSDETSIEITSEENEETEEYMISFEADLSTLELDEIVLYYEIPDDLEVESTFTLTAVVTDLEDETNIEECEVTITIVENETDETEDESEETESEDETTSSYMQENNNSQNGNNLMNQTGSTDYSSTSQNNMEQNSGQSSNQSMDMADTASTSSQSSNSKETTSTEQTDSTTMSDEEEVTYNGSSNNYLSELYIDGYSLNKDFNKERSTYFVTVSDVDSITVTATAEDDEATVCIYGADNLSDGENKILISVTAENWNVRYYRIYVAKD